MHLHCTEYKTKSAYEDTLIYYMLNVVNLLHVSVTICGRLQGGVFRRLYYKDLISLQPGLYVFVILRD
jgi:hypothetical protein